MIVSRQMAEQAARTLRMQLDDATEIMVNTAFKSMAKVHHPDREGGDAAKFVEIDKAKCVLLKWLARPKASPPPDANIPVNACLQCGGKGRRRVQRGFRSMTIVCGSCRGTGEQLPPEKLEE